MEGDTASIANLDSDAGANPGMKQGFEFAAYILCPSDLEGSYTLQFDGEGGWGYGPDYVEPYSAFFDDVTWTEISPGSYEVSVIFGGLMEYFYSPYGGSINKGTYMEDLR